MTTTACDDQFAQDLSGRDAALDALAREVQPHEWLIREIMRYRGYLITWGEYVQRRKELAADPWPEERMDIIGRNGNGGEHYGKQPRYQDAKGGDWIDEFARTATVDEFRGAMRFTIGKYVRRVGRKDRFESELLKIEDYCRRWRAYEAEVLEQ